MKRHTKLPLLIIVLMVAFTFSASAQAIDMADVMRANGKIYVVVAVALIVMLGILFYLAHIDRKVSALEKKLQEKE